MASLSDSLLDELDEELEEEELEDDLLLFLSFLPLPFLAGFFFLSESESLLDEELDDELDEELDEELLEEDELLDDEPFLPLFFFWTKAAGLAAAAGSAGAAAGFSAGAAAGFSAGASSGASAFLSFSPSESCLMSYSFHH